MSQSPFDLSQALFHERYILEHELKSGGMGTVYRALDVKTNRHVAVKTLNRTHFENVDARTQLALEACITGPVKSDHIVLVLDAGIDQKSRTPFLVMEFLHGSDLDDVLSRSGKFSPDDVVHYLWQAAFAVDKAHEAGIVHRDLKPGNLFLTTRDDGAPHIKVLDFGVAKVIAQSSIAKTTRIVGTPVFMSPEQVDGIGQINGRADIYALGHIAFALLVGKPYWDLEANDGLRALLNRIAKGVPESATQRAQRLGESLPEAFDAWFARATTAQPEQRFASANELVAALGAALDVPLPQRDARRSSVPDRTGQPSLPGPETNPGWARQFFGFTQPGAKKRRALIAVTLLVLLVVSVVGAMAQARRRPPVVAAGSQSVATPPASSMPGPAQIPVPMVQSTSAIGFAESKESATVPAMPIRATHPKASSSKPNATESKSARSSPAAKLDNGMQEER